ncbi:DUF2252 domain-containing protein [Glaciibacter flavus]|uniref:DUF2252 domain-containing protein n=1 Tax=Orlajensenia flava TaxID=2565934 RepID=UPI003AFF841D
MAEDAAESSALGALRFDHAHVTTQHERKDAGRAARAQVPRSAHAEYRPSPERDPLGIIERQNADRLDWLVPLRTERMLASPFAFYRGTAALQAADLAGGVTTGAHVTLCGDAHITNFGLYASPQRTLVFDLNDFDESAAGPWEWDVKRLVTSVIVAGREKGFEAKRIRSAAVASARSYRTSLAGFLRLDPLRRFYLRADVETRMTPFGASTRHAIADAVSASKKRTSARAFAKITERADDGSVRIVEQPPTLTHVPAEMEARVGALVELYLATLPPELALLLSQYTATDVARRVVGVGSVGTRCYIVVLTGPLGEPLVLQVKEAGRSVLNEYGALPPIATPGVDAGQLVDDPGYRVVASQRILQAVSDPFLGYLSVDGRGYYVRQFRDRNVSFDVAALGQKPFTDYVAACASMLARAHAQSPDAAFVSGYLGGSSVFDEAVVDWSEAYADQSFADFTAFRAAQASASTPS